MSKNKKTKRNFQPKTSKTTKIKTSEVEFAEGRLLAWRFSFADRNGVFSWSKLDDAEKHKKIIEKLREFENFTAKSILNVGCHYIDREELSAEAENRLQELQLDDVNGLYSLRICGRERIFCILDVNIMKILWWDPHHTVCLSHKKNT
jgi:hypothetical protein